MHDDKNEVIELVNDLQQNQWCMMDRLTSLHRGQKMIPEILERLEGKLEHMEGHVHYAFCPPSSIGNG